MDRPFSKKNDKIFFPVKLSRCKVQANIQILHILLLLYFNKPQGIIKSFKEEETGFKKQKVYNEKTQPHKNMFSWDFHPSHKLNWTPKVEKNYSHFLQLHA